MYTHISLSGSAFATNSVLYNDPTNIYIYIYIHYISVGLIGAEATWTSCRSWSTDKADVVFQVTALKLPTNTARRTDWGWLSVDSQHTHTQPHTHAHAGGKIHFIAGIW